MRARRAMAVCGAVVAATAASATAHAAPTAIGVSEREFRIGVYRTTVAPGPVRFNVTNFGEDVHDLVVLAPGGRRLAATGEIRAGRRATLPVRLARRGVYALVCTKLDHAARGMRTRLRVR
jgi:plastocyanin